MATKKKAPKKGTMRKAAPARKASMKKAAKKAAPKKTARKSAVKKAAKKAAPRKVAKRAMKKAATKRTVVKKAATKKTATRKVAKKAAPKRTLMTKAAKTAKKAAPRKVASKVAPKKSGNRMPKKSTKHNVAPTTSTLQRSTQRDVTKDWPQAVMHDVENSAPETAPEQPGTKPFKSFAQQAREKQPKPNELHPGQTAQTGPSHDRPGSQPERVRHLYPNANKPNAGSGRSAQYKGKRLDNNGDRD